jgi:radical SAM protein with 4Fe4S-binding SPASM domain
MDGTKIYDSEYCAACYFRTIAKYPNKKCLIQLTERCNLHCEHCFINADGHGKEIAFERIERYILPQLLKNHITKVTLTGGEPFVYRQLSDVVRLLSERQIYVGICTNASLVTEEFLDKIRGCNVHFNVSLDGFAVASHGRFRGNTNPEIFERIKSNIRLLGERRLLKGVLVTPNRYTPLSEYIDICDFARGCCAEYILMNPLSQFGRGEEGVSVALGEEEMEQLRRETQRYDDGQTEMVYIRFPNREKKPLGECVAGKIMYIFTNGDIAYCPYMVFAARNRVSRYTDNEFIMGNIFEEGFEWEKVIGNYRFPIDFEDTCSGCTNTTCKRGCYASKISQGMKLSDADVKICPMKAAE